MSHTAYESLSAGRNTFKVQHLQALEANFHPVVDLYALDVGHAG